MLTPEEFADKVTEILEEELSKLPEDEKERRLEAFEKTCKEIFERRQP